MPSPVELLKQECRDASPRLDPVPIPAAAHVTPNKQDRGPYFQSHHFQTPSARHAQLSAADPKSLHHSCSPLLRTPSTGSSRGSGNTPRTNTPGSSGSIHRMTTPRYHTTPGGSTHPIVFNPFENQLLDKLKTHSPMFSPNMFKVTEPGSAEKSPTEFRWSIDQLAILKPAKLEERPIQQDTLNIVRDPKEEARVQDAIDLYFQAGNIVPSPWTNNVRKVFFPRTPDPDREPSTTLLDNADPQANAKHEAGCQTELTLPADFNLQQVLGEHFTFTSSQQQPPKGIHGNHHHVTDSRGNPEVEGDHVVNEDGEEDPEMVLAAQARAEQVAASVAALFDDGDHGDGDEGAVAMEGPSSGEQWVAAAAADLSTSSLRRKLFFHGDEGTPLSPVRSNKSRVGEIMDMSSPAVSPVRSHASSSHMSSQRHSPLITPASSQFSSSPIGGQKQKPSLRRYSTAPTDLSYDSPQISPILNSASSKGSRGIPGTPMCLPLQATPSSDRLSKPLHSPGFSPIHQGGDGSYVSSPPDKHFSRSDSLRRRALIGQIEKHTTTPSPDLSPFNLLQRAPLFCSSPSPIPAMHHYSVDVKAIEDAKCRIDFDQHPMGDIKDIDLSGIDGDEMDVSACGVDGGGGMIDKGPPFVVEAQTVESQNKLTKYVSDNRRPMEKHMGGDNMEDSAVMSDNIGDDHDFARNIGDDHQNFTDEAYSDNIKHSTAAFRDFREGAFDFDCETTTGFHNSISSTMCSGGGVTQGQDTMYHQSQDTGYQTQYSAMNEATMSTNLTNHFSNLPAVLGASQDEGSPTESGVEMKHSLEQMSEFYDQMGKSLSEAGTTKDISAKDKEIPTGETDMQSDTLNVPKGNELTKCKSKEKVFEELQQFANKFSPTKFERQMSDASALGFQAGHSSELHSSSRLHKSYSVGEFKTSTSVGKDLFPNIHHSKTNSALSYIESNNNDINPKVAQKDTKVHFQLDDSQTQDSFESQRQFVQSDYAQQPTLAQQGSTSESPPEHLGDLPSFEKVHHVRPKTLVRSLSDYTGSRFHYGNEIGFHGNDDLVSGQIEGQGQSEGHIQGQGLYKGRSAHTNPAFTIETLTPNSQHCVSDDSQGCLAKEQTKELSGSHVITKDCDSKHLMSNVGLPISRFGSKLTTSERSGNIRPRLLFADNDTSSESCSRISTLQNKYQFGRKERPDILFVDTHLSKDLEHESLLKTQYSLPEGVTGRSSADTLHVSPKSSLAADKKILVNAKRVLADQYAISQARTKRRSPTQLDEDT